jgi:TonB family protein
MLMLLTSCRATTRRPARSGDACLRRSVGTLLVVAGSSLTSLATFAQTTPAPSEVAPSERAKRDADKVFHWILIQGDRTRKAPASGAKDGKDTKDAKEAKDERPAAKAIKLAAPEVGAPRLKEATVAAAEPVNPKAAGKLAAGAAPSAELAVDAHKAEDARLARAEPVHGVAAPAVEVSDEAPQGLVAVAQPAPQFSINTMRALRRGNVQVRFSVLTDGSVANLEVLNSTSPRLNAAALEAIGQWRFQPISKVQTGAVEVGFNLE